MAKKCTEIDSIEIILKKERIEQDEPVVHDDKTELLSLLWRLVKKYIPIFARKGEENNGTSD